jgi:hypothetical protein
LIDRDWKCGSCRRFKRKDSVRSDMNSDKTRSIEISIYVGLFIAFFCLKLLPPVPGLGKEMSNFVLDTRNR